MFIGLGPKNTRPFYFKQPLPKFIYCQFLFKFPNQIVNSLEEQNQINKSWTVCSPTLCSALNPWLRRFKLGRQSCWFQILQRLKAHLHWRFYLDENVSVLATVSMFVVMDVYDSHGKQIHQPWDTLGRCGLKNRKSSIFSKRYAQGTIITLIIL